MMKLQERFDIYNERQEWQGTEARQEVHRRGLWHATFQCWVWRQGPNGPELLFQLRHPDKDTFPGLLDISCAGHLQVGETPEDGVRELEEELGLSVPYGALTSCGMYRSEKELPGGGWDREFCSVFVYRCDMPLHSYRIQIDELTGLYFIGAYQLERLLLGNDETLEAVGVEISAEGELADSLRSFALTDFVPHHADYFRLVLHHIAKAAD